jgi:hypothetical protein
MASSGNFCTWTPLLGIKDDGSSGITFSNGNTTATQTHNGIATTGTHAVSSGKFYWEIYYSASSDFSDGHLLAGWQSLKYNVEYAYTKQQPGSGQGAPDRNVWGSHLMNYKGAGTSAFQGGYLSAGNDVNNDTYDGAYNLGLRVGSAKTLQFAGDFDNYKLYFGVDNTWYSLANSGTGSSGANTDSGSFNTSYGWSIESAWQGYQWTPACWFSGAASGTVATINAGQDSTFSGRLTAGGNSDDNGFGDFRYAPPTGFLALCSANLPISDDIDPAQTDDNIGEKQVNAVTYTGNGTSVNVTGFGFAPDLVWVKMRSPHAYNNMIFDSSRGVHKHLSSDRSSTEYNTTNSLTSFDSDGFTYGTELSGNDSGDSIMSWGWRANGGTTATNNDGSVTSTVQANQAAGFSIVTFTGINSATTATVGHGLGKAPTAIMHFCRTSATYPFFRIKGATNASTVRSTNPNGSPTDVSGSGGALSDPTSSVFSINNYTGIGGGGKDYVAYCWAPIEGYSKFGNFTGNGNADGPFIYTGFRPKIVVLIAEPYGRENFIFDTTRDTVNPIKTYLRWGRTNTESTNSAYEMDFLSNGFKIRGTFGGDINGSDENNLYMCWGDVPFKYNNTF